MTQPSCTCGYQADDADDLAVHLGEMFIPADDTAPDGQVHCEGASTSGILTCRCGFAGAVGDFDQHLLAMFTPDDHIGLDGKRHAAISG
jgi:hypothetical protein